MNFVTFPEAYQEGDYRIDLDGIIEYQPIRKSPRDEGEERMGEWIHGVRFWHKHNKDSTVVWFHNEEERNSAVKFLDKMTDVIEFKK